MEQVAEPEDHWGHEEWQVKGQHVMQSSKLRTEVLLSHFISIMNKAQIE